MGWNTCILIQNDAVDQISANPAKWWKEGIMPILTSGGIGINRKDNERCYVDVGAGNHGNASSVFHVSHIDSCGVYVVGGGYVSRLGWAYEPKGGHHTEEGKIEILREIAGKLGYQLVKK